MQTPPPTNTTSDNNNDKKTARKRPKRQQADKKANNKTKRKGKTQGTKAEKHLYGPLRKLVRAIKEQKMQVSEGGLRCMSDVMIDVQRRILDEVERMPNRKPTLTADDLRCALKIIAGLDGDTDESLAFQAAVGGNLAVARMSNKEKEP